MCGSFAMAATLSYRSAAGRHERDRGAKPGLGPKRCYAAPRLNRLARASEELAERPRGVRHVLDHECQPPQARGAGGVTGDARALGRLDDLEDRLAGAEERLPR